MIDKILQAKRLRNFLWILLILSGLLLAFSLGYPLMHKAEMVSRLSVPALSASRTAAVAISDLRGDALLQLQANPQNNASYRELCNLLAHMRDGERFDKIYMVTKGIGGKYYYLLDAAYRENATAEVDYFAAGQEFSGAVYQAGRSTLERVFDGRQPASNLSQILTTDDHRPVVAALTPVLAPDGQIIAVLVTEVSAADVNLSHFGPVDLGLLALISGIVFVLTFLIIIGLHRWRKKRTLRKKEEEAKQAASAGPAEVTAELLKTSGEETTPETQPPTPEETDAADIKEE